MVILLIGLIVFECIRMAGKSRDEEGRLLSSAMGIVCVSEFCKHRSGNADNPQYRTSAAVCERRTQFSYQFLYHDRNCTECGTSKEEI